MKARTLATISLLAAIAVGVGAWLWYRERYPSWVEEVKLRDGRVVRIDQRHEYYRNYGTSRSWTTVTLPELGGTRTWVNELTPQRIDVFDGTVYAFGFPRGEKQFAHYGSPKHYIVAFRWNGTAFERIPFLAVPEEIRDSENVYSCIPESRAQLVSLAEKERHWCPERGDRWKFGRKIILQDYEALAGFYAGLRNSTPRTD